MTGRISLSCLLTFVSVMCVSATASALDVPIQTTDVDLFYRIYDAHDGQPSAEVLKRCMTLTCQPGCTVDRALRRLPGTSVTGSGIASAPRLGADQGDARLLHVASEVAVFA